MAAGVGGLDFGRGAAQSSSWRGGGASGQYEGGLDTRNQAGAARVGRRDVDGGTQQLSSARARRRGGEKREQGAGKDKNASARRSGRDDRRVEELTGGHSRRYERRSDTVQHKRRTVASLNYFDSILSW
jgi:hypothetical protein